MSLTKDCLLPPLVQLSKPASFLASIAFYWNSKENGFEKMGARGLFRHKVTTYVHAVSVGSMIFQMIAFWESNFSRALISSFGLIVLYFTLITVWVYHRNLDKAVALINDLIRTSEEFQKAETRRVELDGTEKFIKVMAPLFHWSAMSVPFAFVGGVVWSMPCLNSSFGYLFLKECTGPEGPIRGEGDRSEGLNVTFIIFILFNLLLWSYSIQCAVFTVIGVEMLGAMSIRSFLKYYERCMMQILSTGNGPSSSTVKLKHTFKMVRDLFNNALIYRRIQLLAKILNEIHSTWILVPLLFTVSSHQVCSLYGAIKLQGQLNFFSYCLFGILANQGVLVIMGMFTALGDVYRMSKKVQGNLVRSHRGHKWLSRFHRGCSQVKIRFGALNYIDSLTPLMFENFALAQAANMLLMK